MHRCLKPMFACCVLTAVAGSMQAAAQSEGSHVLDSAKRIVFLGDSITWDGRYVADLIAWMVTRYPDHRFDVIDVGLSSETVSGLTEEGHANGAFPRPYLHDRLARVLEKTKPDLVFACYGMNCAIYKPFDEERFTKYKDGITQLRDAVKAANAEIVLITPPVYDAKHAGSALAEYNDVLGKYSDWLLSMRETGWKVIDLHAPMTAELQKRREEKADFTFEPDGVHPDDAGHWFMARQIILYLGDAATAQLASANELPHAKELLPLAQERMSVGRDAWLTYTGHTRPGVPDGVSIDKAIARDKELQDRMIETVTGKK